MVLPQDTTEDMITDTARGLLPDMESPRLIPHDREGLCPRPVTCPAIINVQANGATFKSALYFSSVLISSFIISLA